MPINLKTAEARQKELAAQLRLMMRFEDIAEPIFYELLKKIADEVADMVEKDETVSVNYVLFKHGFEIERALKAHYALVIESFSARTFRAVNKITQKSYNPVRLAKAVQDTFTELARQWIATNALDQSALISDTTQQDIITVLLQGQKDGLGAGALASLIRQKVGKEISATRARTIAITETHNAATYASLEATTVSNNELDLGMQKKWLPVEDSRTRAAHAAMEHKPAIGLDEPFNVGGQSMQRPGDPNGGASQVINCRCALIYEIPDE